MTTGERPFDAIRLALADPGDTGDEPAVRLDPGRVGRTGVPEFVLAGAKRVDEVASSLQRLAEANGRAVATRCTETMLRTLPALVAGDFEISVHETARSVVLARRGTKPIPTGGRVCVITAGSSDAPVAAEATLIASEMGCAVTEVRDVGVAGLHRLVRPLERVVGEGVDAIVVAAGMDGALPSVVAGLVAVPVIGLPTSTGYGHGGDGTAALLTMLQSCAPGIVVVNIDNGVGAGASAALIANRIAAARGSVARPVRQ